MAETFTSSASIKPAATTPATLYTAPASTKSMVLAITACNKGGAAAAVTIRNGKSGDTEGSLVDKELINNRNVDSNDALLYSEKVVLAAGDFIEVEASTADVVFTATAILEIT